MEEHVETRAVATSRMRRMARFLLSLKAGTALPSLFFAVLLLTPLSRTVMSLRLLGKRQISGYYLDGLFLGLLFAVGAAWLLSIILLFATRQIKRGVGRILAVPAILFLGGIAWIMPMLFFPARISGWPMDSVYSASRDKFFILADEPILIDTIYRVFSAKGSRLNPIWRVELPEMILEYPEDGSLTKNPRLILSKDEQLLVVGRGGHLTDAILIDSRQPLTHFISWTDEDREQQWQQRTDTILRLLAHHDRPVAPPIPELSESEVKARLDRWCERAGPALMQAIPGEGWQFTCAVEELEPARQGLRPIVYTVMCRKGDAQQVCFRRMSLIEDGGQLLIAEQDTGLSGSSNTDQHLCEQVRSALLEFAGSGTYLDDL